MMNNLAVSFIFVVSVSAFAQELLINGNFETGSTGWNEWWGGNSGIGDHTADYGNNPPVNNDAGVWWTDDAFFQDVAIGAEQYGGSNTQADRAEFLVF